MNFNVQWLLWARKSICLPDYKEITAKNFGWKLRMDSEVNLMSAGWTDKPDHGLGFHAALKTYKLHTLYTHFIKEYRGKTSDIYAQVLKCHIVLAVLCLHSSCSRPPSPLSPLSPVIQRLAALWAVFRHFDRLASLRLVTRNFGVKFIS